MEICVCNTLFMEVNSYLHKPTLCFKKWRYICQALAIQIFDGRRVYKQDNYCMSCNMTTAYLKALSVILDCKSLP